MGAELVVVGSQGRTALNRIIVGSVSSALVKNAQSSMEVIRVGETSASRAP
jgi:nucleotide-binding universal stress UspA family protein